MAGYRAAVVVMTSEEQRQEVKDIIAYYEARGLDWLDIVSYRAACFTGQWPPPKPQRRNVGGRPRKTAPTNPRDLRR